MKTITILNEKGGCAKTSLSTHIAAGLAIKGSRVILVDTDPQGHATIAVGLEKRPHFYDLCVRDAPWKSVLQMVHPDVYSPKNSQAKGQLFCVASNHEVYSTAANMTRQSIIRQRFRQMDGHVDYIIVDTSPTPSTLHEAIVAASDYILMPTECEFFSSFEGLPESIEHTGNVRAAGLDKGRDVAQLLGIIPSKYNESTVLHIEVLETLKKEYGNLVWEPVPFAKAFAQAQMRKQFLFSLYPRNKVTLAVWQIINRLEAVCQTV